VAFLVNFRHGNIVAPDFLQDDAPYHVVFCRNLLIYLHPEARALTFAALRRLVAEGGVLVVGHAEAALAREQGFTPTGPPAAFAFINHGTRVVPEAPSANHRRVPANIPTSPAFVAGTPVPTPLARVAPAAPSTSSQREPEPSSLVVARRLGDAGNLHDALRVCGEYLHKVPDSAEGHFLLGVLQDALGDLHLAVRSFRKALYLDPTHREALLHLALKQESLGDVPGAALLRERARRAGDAYTGE
jgi:chemotaxis protein methyltransferase WspC